MKQELSRRRSGVRWFGAVACLVTVLGVGQVVAATSALRLGGVTDVAGRDVTLPIQLLATGQENALGFSLAFDPARLSYLGEIPGPALTGNGFNVNSNQAAAGRIGYAIARPAGGRFPAGTQDLLRVRFRLGTTVTNTSVVFGDVPVAREVADELAGPLEAAYSDAVVTITPQLAPVILQSSPGQSAVAGQNVTLNVLAAGSPPMNFQWLFNGVPLPGATSVVTAPLACVPVRPALAGWWAGEGNALDSAGTNHGVATNGLVYVAGRSGQAFGLDGVNDFVVIPDRPELSPHVGVTGEMTLEAWVKVDRLPPVDAVTGQDRRVIVGKGSPSNWEYALNLLTNGSVQFSLWTPAGAGHAEPAGGRMSTGVWHHVAGTLRKGAYARVYLDGELVAETTSFGGDTGNGTSPLFIGRRGDAQFFAGQIDEVAIYHRALCAADIAHLRNAGGIGAYAPQAGDAFAGSLRLTNVGPAQAGEYRVVASNDGGSSTSGPIALVVNVAPTIVQPPVSRSVATGESVLFTVSATGTAPLEYQWRRNGVALPGRTNAALVLTNVAVADAGTYTVAVSNPGGTAVSAGATLTVSPAPRLVRLRPAPTITGAEVDVPVELAGFGDENAIGFSLAFNPDRLAFVSAALGAGAAGGSLNVNSLAAGAGRIGVAVTRPAGQAFPSGPSTVAVLRFRVGDFSGPQPLEFTDSPVPREVADVLGESRPVAWSNAVVEVLSTPPSIVTQPAGVTGRVFDPATLAVTAIGSAPLAFQWQRNGVNLPGATGPTLTLNGLTPAAAGAYRVTVANAVGAVTSTVAQVVVRRVVRWGSTNAATGTEFEVPLELLAAGDENAVGLSLAFDPARLEFLSATSNVPGLNVNTAAAASGRVGLAATRGFGEVWPAGTQVVARVRFRAGGLAGPADLACVDVPVVRELADFASDALPADFDGATLTLRHVPPVITRQPAGAEVFQGTSLTLQVDAVGSLPLGFQWQRNGSAIPGATNRSLTLTNILVAQAGSYLAEVRNAGGVTNSLPAIVTVRPPPGDLFPLTVSAPAEVVAGTAVSVVWSVTNRGSLVAQAPWRDQVFVADNAAGDNAVPLAELTIFTSLATNSSVTRTSLVIFPADTRGTRFVGVNIDSGFQIPEADEGNNRLTRPVPTVVRAADLVAVAVTPGSAAARFGERISVTWSVRNDGDATASAGWVDRVYLATTSNSLAGATALATVAVPGNVAPGSNYQITVDVDLPASSAALPPGTYHLVVVADAGDAQVEVDSANNLRSAPIQLSHPPLPNLAVVSVTAPAVLRPGEPGRLVWAVTNRGESAAAGPWLESLSFSNASGLQPLGFWSVSNSLAAGAVAWRTQVVSLPIQGPAGALRFVVEADSRREVFESVETDNTGVAGAATTVPLTLTLQFAAAAIAEDAADPVLPGTVTRNGDRSQALTVNLAGSDDAELQVPAAVTIAAGQAYAVFPATVVPDGRVDADKVVTVTASAAGFAAGTANVTVLNRDQPALAFELATNVVREGLTVSARVIRDVVTDGPVSVLMNSSSPGQVSVPSGVTIPAGSNAVTFAVLAIDDVAAEAAITYTLTASAAGHRAGSASLTVVDNDVPSLAVTVSSPVISEGGGNQAAILTITRQPAGPGALLVELAASEPSLVLLPARITIPAGQSSASVPVAVVDDGDVNGSRQVSLGAFGLASGSGVRLVEAVPAVLTVTDDDGPALRLRVSPTLVREGLNPAATLTVSRNTPATSSLVVQLASNDESEARVPVSVTLPAGVSSIEVPVVSMSDQVPDGNQAVVLSAAAAGHAGAAVTLTVSDQDLPDLTLGQLTTPAGGSPRQRVTVSYRVLNQGVASTAGSLLTRLYLSPDPVVGDDTLVAQFRTTNSLAPGQFLDGNEQIELPLNTGRYWLIAETDAEQSVPEILEDNNIAVAVNPIAVAANYGAWVQADVDVGIAGRPVPFHGRTTNALGAPVGGQPANVHVVTRGIRRVISVTSDAAGDFSGVFQPLPGEAGRYELSATHPGVSTVPVQDQFTLLGLRANPSSVAVGMIAGGVYNGSVAVENLSEVPLHGLTATVVSRPAGLNVAVTPGGTDLASSLPLDFRLAAAGPDAAGDVVIRVNSVEGATAELRLRVTVEPLRARLVAVPESLSLGLVRGSQAVLEFSVVNQGGAASGPVTVSLPGLPWLHLASTNPLPSLGVGESNRVILVLTPPADAPLSQFNGSLALNAADASLTVPLSARVLSDAAGTVGVEVVDEFTYFVAGGPRVTNATVEIRDAISRELITNGVVDVTGHFIPAPLREGYYSFAITAPQHHTFQTTLLVEAGRTNALLAFLPRETVTYNWTVTPIEVEDRYRITVESVFEANVPVPVVTLSPSTIDFASLVYVRGVAQIDVTLENHGLIAAQDVVLNLPTHPRYQFSALITDIGALPARSRLTIPVTVREKTGIWATLDGSELVRQAFVPATAAPADGGGIEGLVEPAAELEPGVPLSEFVAAGATRSFRLRAPEGRTVEVLLEPDPGSGARLAVRQDGSALPATADPVGPVDPLRQRVIVPSVGAGDYDVLVSAPAGSAGGAFLVTARVLPFQVSRVAAARLGRGGPATVRLEGAGFDAATQVELRRNGERLGATAVVVENPTRLYATFDLAGAAPGTWQARAYRELITYEIDTNAGAAVHVPRLRDEAVGPGGIDVEAEGAASLTAHFGDLRQTGLPGVMAVSLVLSNAGSLDRRLPVVRVATAPGVVLGLAPELGDSDGPALEIAVTGPTGRPVLVPGEAVAVTLYAQSGGAGFFLSVADLMTPSTLLAWDTVAAFYQDLYAGADWAGDWGRFRQTAGDSTDTLSVQIARIAPRVWSNPTEPAMDADRLILRLLDEAGASPGIRRRTRVVAASPGDLPLWPGAGEGFLRNPPGPPPAWLLRTNQYRGLEACLNAWGNYSDAYLDYWEFSVWLDMNTIFRPYFGGQAADLYNLYLDCPGGVTPPEQVYGDGDEVVEGFSSLLGDKTGFANSPDTKAVIQKLLSEAQNRIRARYNCRTLPEVVPLTSLFTPAEIATIAKEMNFSSFKSDIAAFLAGGVGSSARLDRRDTREITGNLRFRKHRDRCGNVRYIEVIPELRVKVVDSIDFCPGNVLGSGFLQGIVSFFDLVPMQNLEANERACAVPFTAEFTPDVENDRMRLGGCKADCCEIVVRAPYYYVCGPLLICRAAETRVVNSGDPDCVSPSSGGVVITGGGGGSGGSIGGGSWVSFPAGGGCAPAGGGFVPRVVPRARDAEGPGVCARVRLRLEQEAVVSRDAFNAVLEIINSSGSPLLDLSVEIQARDAAGHDASDRFGVRPPSLANLNAVDGTGTLAGNTTGRAGWILIPTVDAAPDAPAQFLISGTLRYTQDGVVVTVPLAPVPITVLPTPRLALQYFHQRDVFSDDPFTDVVEPMVPYNLAVMVHNRGQGTARNFRITSAQPKIVENEKGLLIDFNLVASEVAGQAVSPSLTVNLGDLGPGAIGIGRWLLTSTLQGLFIDYSATFEHVDGLGNPRLSIIDEVSIHEMIHLVEAGGPLADGLPDFLVNGVPDARDLPDTIYLSNGSTGAVEVVEQAVFDRQPDAAHLQVQMTASLPGGWAYLRVPDPASSGFHLVRVVRSDGVEVPVGTNAWATDRTFIGLGRRPIRENILHLVDYNSPGSYTLSYAPGVPALTDTNPPVSRVATLPPASRPYFQVGWSGIDEGPLGQATAGIAYYDIYVSENGGAFARWLEQTRLVSATYVGQLGSRYAFYSIATDAAGNREVLPAGPDAETTVSLTNRPPVIGLPAQVSVNEGDTLDLAFTAGDPDTDQSLSISFLGNPPPGLVLDAAGRRLRWVTGEGNGPGTNVVTLVVTDDGVPSLSATGRITVIVAEVNQSPVLSPVADGTLLEGQLLSFAAVAGDFDLPVQSLRFALLPGAPTNASLDPVTGLFQWRPTDTQGGTTNRLGIVVRDNGTPSLAATQRFTVVVRDTRPDFLVRLGSTNVLSGETNSVELELRTGLDLTRLDFRLDLPVTRLTGLNLRDTVPGLQSASLVPLGPGASRISLVASPGETMQGEHVLARLGFTADTNSRSAEVPLRPSEVTGLRSSGESAFNAGTIPGRVILVAREPVLEAVGVVDGVRRLTLFGRPGHRYSIETQSPLTPVDPWRALLDVQLPGRSLDLSPHTGQEPAVLYRARELP